MLMSQSDDEDDAPDKTDDEAIWLESKDEPNESDFTYMCAPDLRAVEVSLVNNAFMHGHYSFVSSASPRVALVQSPTVPFNGVVIDTAANRRSIILMAQYRAYEHEF